MLKRESVVKGVESSSILYAQEVVADERMREIECPVCGMIRDRIESDAVFTYECEECGIKVQVPEFENSFL